MNGRPSILYVAYWGAAEPLGQSLIVPAVERLASSVALTLITFEKPMDLENRVGIDALRTRFARAGIRWIPLRYHKRPKIPATAFDVAHGIAIGIREAIRRRPTVVHARTFIGGLIGFGVSRTLRLRFLYHNEGFYPDEQVDGGVWRAGSIPHRVARRLENVMYRGADAIICMSRRSKVVLEAMMAAARKKTPILVVPSCVDLSDFPRRNAVPPPRPLRLIYIGSVGNRYILDKLARFVSVAREVFPDLHLRVLTGADRSVVTSMLRAGSLPDDAWSLDKVPHSQVSAELAQSHAGLFFLQSGISEFGCSPTKIGEYWATGVPVVTTAGVSDTDDIIATHRVGVVIRDHADDAYRKATRELEELFKDPQLSERCRQAAEMFYSLDPFTDAQRKLYAEFSNA
jgi:glycosyltransferase involved in cell wall biosynthesis